MAVQDLQQLHDQIAKDQQRATRKKLRETSNEIFTLKKQLRKPGSPETKQDIADRVTHLQHEQILTIGSQGHCLNYADSKFLQDHHRQDGA
jgi:argininosuccinate lyase